MDINDLRRSLKAAADDMEVKAKAIDDLEAAEAPDSEAIAAAVEEFKAAETEFNSVQVKLNRAEAIEKAKAATATSELDAGGTTAPQGLPAVAADPEQKGVDCH